MGGKKGAELLSVDISLKIIVHNVQVHAFGRMTERFAVSRDERRIKCTNIKRKCLINYLPLKKALAFASASLTLAHCYAQCIFFVS